MKKTLSYQDFPVTKTTEHLKIWKGFEIKQKGKITIGKDEEIFESRIYPFKEGKDKIKVLSKINKKTNQISFVITSENITSALQSASIEIYYQMMKELEQDLQEEIMIDENNFLTGKQILTEINRD